MNLKHKSTVVGVEIIADFKDCNERKLHSLKSFEFESILSELIKNSKLTEVGKALYDFDVGFTCIFALAESHIAIHTWPKEKYVSLNIHVCNYSQDNTGKARDLFHALKKFFIPKSVEYTEILRNFY